MPTHTSQAYNKGDHEDPGNYRPISLLNTSFKIYTHIIHQRITKHIDPQLGNLQFGFREGKSTSEPIFCVRRLQDIVEQGREKLILILLDWEKTFDKIDHGKMLQALTRIGIPAPLLEAIRSLYEEPHFAVKCGDALSDWYTQRTGIRLGCPLSPYLFILTMHVMFSDISQHLEQKPIKKTTLFPENFMGDKLQPPDVCRRYNPYFKKQTGS